MVDIDRQKIAQLARKGAQKATSTPQADQQTFGQRILQRVQQRSQPQGVAIQSTPPGVEPTRISQELAQRAERRREQEERAQQTRQRLIELQEAQRRQSVIPEERERFIREQTEPARQQVRQIAEQRGVPISEQDVERIALSSIELPTATEAAAQAGARAAREQRAQRSQELQEGLLDEQQQISAAPEESLFQRATRRISNLIFGTRKEEQLERTAEEADVGPSGPIGTVVDFTTDFVGKVAQGAVRGLGLVEQTIQREAAEGTQKPGDPELGLQLENIKFTPTNELASRLTGVPQGGEFTAEQSGTEAVQFANLLGAGIDPDQLTPEQIGTIGLMFAGIEASDLITLGSRRAATKGGAELFDAVRRADFNDVRKIAQRFVKKGADEKEAQEAVQIIESIARNAQSADEITDALDSLRFSDNLVGKARQSRNIDEFRQSLDAGTVREITRRGVDADRVFNAVKRVDDAKQAVRQTGAIREGVADLARRGEDLVDETGRTLDDLPDEEVARQLDIPEETVPLAREARKFDSAEELFNQNVVSKVEDVLKDEKGEAIKVFHGSPEKVEGRLKLQTK